MKLGFRKTEGSVTTAAVVNISPREQIEIAKEVLLSLLEIPNTRHFIRDGKVWEAEEDYRVVDDWQEKPIRDVRPLDVELFAVLHRLQRGNL